jgi:hypothetical protein
MNKRPLSVSIIAWLLIVFAVLSAVTIPFTLMNPMAQELMAKCMVSVPVQYFMMFAGLLISIVTGVFMLKRRELGAHALYNMGRLRFPLQLDYQSCEVRSHPGFVNLRDRCFLPAAPKSDGFFHRHRSCPAQLGTFSASSVG